MCLSLILVMQYTVLQVQSCGLIPFLVHEKYTLVCLYLSFCIAASLAGQFCGFSVLAAVSRAAVKAGLHAPLSFTKHGVLSWYWPGALLLDYQVTLSLPEITSILFCSVCHQFPFPATPRMPLSSIYPVQIFGDVHSATARGIHLVISTCSSPVRSVLSAFSGTRCCVEGGVMKIDLLILASGKSPLFCIPFLIPTLGHLWTLGIL